MLEFHKTEAKLFIQLTDGFGRSFIIHPLFPTPLTKQSKHIHLVGDCAGIGNLRTVIWKAYEMAMAI